MSSPSGTLGLGVIGIGFMGQTHVRCYAAAQAVGLPCELIAVCDASRGRLSGRIAQVGNLAGASGDEQLFDPVCVRGYTEVDAFLTDPRLDAVSICTYTDSHVDLAIRALRAGKHVLVEKPVAVKADGVRRLVDAAAATDRLCMPAMCMRFWPGWDWLRDRINDRTWGSVRSAAFHRLGSGPSWGAEFYRDEARSGGALVDLHIHDVDFVYWCFGMPRQVLSSGTTGHVLTVYDYGDPNLLVSAEGGWTLSRGAGFRMLYRVCFERATVEFDLARSPTVRIFDDERELPSPSLPTAGGYQREIESFVLATADRSGPRPALRATLDDALSVARILDAERESLRTGRETRL